MNRCGYVAGVLHDPTSKVPSTPGTIGPTISVCGDKHRDALKTDSGQGVEELWGKGNGTGLVVRPSRFLRSSYVTLGSHSELPLSANQNTSTHPQKISLHGLRTI